MPKRSESESTAGPKLTPDEMEEVVKGIYGLLCGPRGQRPRMWTRRGIAHFPRTGKPVYHSDDHWLAVTRENADGTKSAVRLTAWDVKNHISAKVIMGAESPDLTDLITFDFDAHPPDDKEICRWCEDEHPESGTEFYRCPKRPPQGCRCDQCGKPIPHELWAPDWTKECACPEVRIESPTDEEIQRLRTEARAAAIKVKAWITEAGLPHALSRTPRHGYYLTIRWPQPSQRDKVHAVAQAILSKALGKSDVRIDVWPAARGLRLPCGSKQRLVDDEGLTKGRKDSWAEAKLWLEQMRASATMDETTRADIMREAQRRYQANAGHHAEERVREREITETALQAGADVDSKMMHEDCTAIGSHTGDDVLAPGADTPAPSTDPSPQDHGTPLIHISPEPALHSAEVLVPMSDLKPWPEPEGSALSSSNPYTCYVVTPDHTSAADQRCPSNPYTCYVVTPDHTFIDEKIDNGVGDGAGVVHLACGEDHCGDSPSSLELTLAPRATLADVDCWFSGFPVHEPNIKVGTMGSRSGPDLFAACRRYWFEGPCGSRYDAVLTIGCVLARRFRQSVDAILELMGSWCVQHQISRSSVADTRREIVSHCRRWSRTSDRHELVRTPHVEPDEVDIMLGAALSSESRVQQAIARIAAYFRCNGPGLGVTRDVWSDLGRGTIGPRGERKRLGQYARDLLIEAGVLAVTRNYSAAATSVSGVGYPRTYAYDEARAREIACGGRSRGGDAAGPADPPAVTGELRGLGQAVAEAIIAIRGYLAEHEAGAEVDLRASTLGRLCGARTVLRYGKRVRTAQLARDWLVERDEVRKIGRRYFVGGDDLCTSPVGP